MRMTYSFITTLLILTCCATLAQSEQPIILYEYSGTSIDLPLGEDNYTYFSIADTNYSIYNLPDHFNKSTLWIEQDSLRKQSSPGGCMSYYPDTLDLKDALMSIDTAQDYIALCQAKAWCIDHYPQVFSLLIAKLSDKRKIGLTNSADLMIADRMQTGDLIFYGHGASIAEDLFTIAGRASWILNELTGESFAVVHGNLTPDDAEKFKKLWIAYIDRLKK